MKFMIGKRRWPQERLYGLVIVEEAGVRYVGLAWSRTAAGFQWKLPKKV